MAEHNQDRQGSGRDHRESRAGASGWRRFWSRFAQTPEPSTAHRLYCSLVIGARDPLYYSMLAVPDTPEGRFEILALHTGLVIRRLGQEGETGRGTAQSLFDLMFADLDSNLRELGVGDLSVGKQMKRLAGQFYARLDVLNDAFDHGEPERLRPMLVTNIYHGTDKPVDAHLDQLIGAFKAIETSLADQAIVDLVDGRINLPDHPPLDHAAAG